MYGREKEQRVIFTIHNFVNFLRKFLSHKEVLKRQWSFAEFATLEMKDYYAWGILYTVINFIAIMLTCLLLIFDIFVLHSSDRSIG